VNPVADDVATDAAAAASRDPDVVTIGRELRRPLLLARAQRADTWVLTLLAALVASAIGLVIAVGSDVVGLAAVPAVVRTAAVALALFGLFGYAPARLLARGELAAHRALLVLPLGAVLSTLLLTVLGYLHVPLKLSLGITIAGAALSIALVHRSSLLGIEPDGRPQRRSPALTRIVLPAFLAAIVAMISLVPIFRSGFATVPGQNGDAVIAVGTAVLLEHHPPGANVTNLPINHIPVEWRSKVPIYYALAAVATLAGQDPIQAFATLSAVILALTALGLFLFATYALRAPPWVALLAVFVVPLDRIVMYVTVHPYYNELWGQFSLPFMLLFGWRYLSKPDRRGAAVFGLFLLLGLLAYPLMVPFPLFFLGTHAWLVFRRARAAGQKPGWISSLHLPRPRQHPLLWVPVAAVAAAGLVVLGRGFYEKTTATLQVIAPWQSLAGWHGFALPFLPFPPFVGMPGSGWADIAGLAIVCLLAAHGLTRLRPDARVPMLVMIVAAVLIGVYFRLRAGGQLFFFKDLAFVGPYVLMVALIELAALAASPARARARATLGLCGLALALVVVPASAAAEIDGTFDQANWSVLGLRRWDQQLPRGSSVRIDVGPNGYQLWTIYMFSDHPLSALTPLGGFFPAPVVGRKADYVIAERTQPRPRDALGPPVYSNEQFELWRMNPRVPGPDISSRLLLDHTASSLPPA
jgi:hypothetical protein